MIKVRHAVFEEKYLILKVNSIWLQQWLLLGSVFNGEWLALRNINYFHYYCLVCFKFHFRFSFVDFFLSCCIQLLNPLLMFVWRRSVLLRGYRKLLSCAHSEISDSEFRGAQNIIWGKLNSNHSVLFFSVIVYLLDILVLPHLCLASSTFTTEPAQSVVALLRYKAVEHKRLIFISFP